MLPARHRLRSARDVSRVRRSRRGARGTFFGIRALPTHGDHPVRFVIVVSRKVSTKAVERNRLTRQVRAWLAGRIAEIIPGHDVLIVAQGRFADYDRDVWEQELAHLFQRLHLFRAS